MLWRSPQLCCCHPPCADIGAELTSQIRSFVTRALEQVILFTGPRSFRATFRNYDRPVWVFLCDVVGRGCGVGTAIQNVRSCASV
jgi:hypothetical protein